MPAMEGIDMLDMATRIEPAGIQAGMTETEIAGLSNVLTSVKVRPEAGGTAMSRVMVEIAKSVETADGRLETFAEIADMTPEQFVASWRTTPNRALADFVKGVNASEHGTDVILERLNIGGIRIADMFRKLAGNEDRLWLMGIPNAGE